MRLPLKSVPVSARDRESTQKMVTVGKEAQGESRAPLRDLGQHPLVDF